MTSRKKIVGSELDTRTRRVMREKGPGWAALWIPPIPDKRAGSWGRVQYDAPIGLVPAVTP